MTLTDLFRTKATAAWAVMVAATLVSWWLGSSHGIDNLRLAGVAILVVAFVKVHLVGRYFMELRTAPVALRRVVDVYVVATGAMLVAGVLLRG